MIFELELNSNNVEKNKTENKEIKSNPINIKNIENKENNDFFVGSIESYEKIQKEKEAIKLMESDVNLNINLK